MTAATPASVYSQARAIPFSVNIFRRKLPFQRRSMIAVFLEYGYKPADLSKPLLSSKSKSEL
jgi:hypothetical protein